MCFSTNRIPNVFRSSQDEEDSVYAAITVAPIIKAVFYGGYSRLNKMTGFDRERAIAARMDIQTGVVRWLKVIINPDDNNTEMVTAMDINPQETRLALFITRHSLNEYEDMGWLIVLGANDGGYASKLMKVDWGSGVNYSRSVVWNSALVFDAYDRVYAAADLVDKDINDLKEAPHALIIWNDFTTDQVIYKELSSSFGRSTALTYDDAGFGQTNLYLGGSADLCNTATNNNADPCMHKSINRIDWNGNVASSFHFTQAGSGGDNNAGNHALIDHLHISCANGDCDQFP